MMEFMRNSKFQQRKTTLLKKARDLQTLCDIKVGLIIYENPSSTAPAEIWPADDLELINQLIDSYRETQNRPTKKRKLDSCSSLAASKKPKTESTTTTEYAIWDDRFDVMSIEKIKDLEGFLAEKIADLKAKCEILKATPPPVVVQEEDMNQSVSGWVVDQVPDAATVTPTYYYDDDVYPLMLGGGHYGSIGGLEHGTITEDEEEYEGFVDEFGQPVSSTGNSMQTMVIPAWNDLCPPQYYSSMLCGSGGSGRGGFGNESAAAMLAEGVGWFIDGHSPLLGAIESYSGPPSALSW